MVSQPFSIYMYRAKYNSNDNVTTQEYDYNISYIVCLQYFLYRYINMLPQVEGGGSTWNLNRKVVNGAVGSGLVKTSASWS